MMPNLRCRSLLAGSALLSLVLAAPWSQGELELASRTSECNIPTNRSCWTTGFDINTDYETSTPSTGVIREYTLTLTEVDNWVGGDGVAKVKAFLVNGQYPGPAITANWGDQIRVTVVNNLVTNGTSIHWHGIRQLNTNTQDGSSGITECPIPPGSSKTYSFAATQYGTSWYHSHFSSQYANGVAGPIVINGPASANYDIDLGALPISDWYYEAADVILARVSNPATPAIQGFPGTPPASDNVLFNGKNINPKGSGGSYETVTLTPGKVHRLRLINLSVNDAFTVSIVGHSLTIIATDFVPVNPQTVTSVTLTVGQRYDVLISADQAVDNYWLNVTYSSGPCGSSNNPYPAAIVTYSGAPSGNPTDPGTAPADSYCTDTSGLTPVVARTAPVSSFSPTTGDTLNVALDPTTSYVYWPVNGSPVNVSWGSPTLQYVLDGTTASIPASGNVVSVPTANTWTFWLIQNQSPVPHPMHLHGHDILIIGKSASPTQPLAPGNSPTPYTSADAGQLNGDNPTRRDTTFLPSFGWLVVAYNTNNPGAWLFHCHVAWHVSQGLSVQYLEQLSSIPSTMDLSTLTENCNDWNAYYPANDPYRQTDSGI